MALHIHVYRHLEVTSSSVILKLIKQYKIKQYKIMKKEKKGF